MLNKALYGKSAKNKYKYFFNNFLYLMQDIEHVVLPSVPPLATFVTTFVMMLPALIKLWRAPTSINFIRHSHS